MNQFMSNLVCEGFFHHVLLKYCHENAEMQTRKFDDVTLQYSISAPPEKKSRTSTLYHVMDCDAVDSV